MPPNLVSTAPIAYGYTHSVLVRIPLSVHSTAPATTDYPLEVTAHWLTCKADLCTPHTQILTANITLSNHTNTAAPAPSRYTQIADRFSQSLPSTPIQSVKFRITDTHIWIQIPHSLSTPQKTAFIYPKTYFKWAGPFKWRNGPEGNPFLVTALPDNTLSDSPIPSVISGILTLHSSGDAKNTRNSIDIQLEHAPDLALPTYAVPAILKIMAFALLGGLILNFMPCVFPILSLKLLELISIPPQHAKRHALYYTTGIIVSLLGLWAIFLTLKQLGYQMGWGFHLQSPLVIVILIWIFSAIALYFMGLLSLPERLYTFSSKIDTLSYTVQSNAWGYRKSFLTGVLTTITATPCTAPFMTTALSAALLATPLVGSVIFIALGIGIAIPFIAIALFPKLHHYLPRPGAWMSRLQFILAMPIILTVVWLCYILYPQVSSRLFTWVILSIVHMGVLSRLTNGYRIARSYKWPIAILTFIGIGMIVSHLVFNTSTRPVAVPSPVSNALNGESKPRFTLAALDAQIESGTPIFVNVTAKWCITCQVNEQTTLGRSDIADLLSSNGIAQITADWTQPNPEITQFLARFNRTGIPFYVLYNAQGSPHVFPQILSPSLIRTQIQTHLSKSL
jgi:thiol:disulfide interchange protein DsbD